MWAMFAIKLFFLFIKAASIIDPYGLQACTSETGLILLFTACTSVAIMFYGESFFLFLAIFYLLPEQVKRVMSSVCDDVVNYSACIRADTDMWSDGIAEA